VWQIPGEVSKEVNDELHAAEMPNEVLIINHHDAGSKCETGVYSVATGRLSPIVCLQDRTFALRTITPQNIRPLHCIVLLGGSKQCTQYKLSD